MRATTVHRLVLSLVLLFGLEAASAATFTVDILADDADAADINPGDGICQDSLASCTLRAAIMEANALPGDDAIEFSVSGTLTVFAGLGPLPPITGYLVIDGTTAPGFNSAGQTLAQAPPVVFLDGTNLSNANHDGLVFSGAAASDSQVLSIGIRNFPDDGISVFTDTDGLIIQGCVIDGNGGGGIVMVNPDANVIGRFYNFLTFQFQDLPNQITNNGGDGIALVSSDNNLVFGNFIGMEADGTTDGGNGGNGISVLGNGSLVGFYDADEQAGNIVANNSGQGISIVGSDNVVYANRVGTGVTAGFFGNGGVGIRLTGNNNDIGADAANAANVIANNSIGIHAGSSGASANGTQIIGNRVGLVEGLGNASDGIRVENATGVAIRGNRVISNGDNGIHVLASAPGAVLRGNEVGVAGTLLRGNDGDGLLISGPNAVIGGDNAGEGNIIGDNGRSTAPSRHGIRLAGDGGQVVGNHIGVTPGGADIGNPSFGLYLQSSVSTVARNVIGHNGAGLAIAGNSHTVEENWIGTDRNGGDFGNDNDGVYLTGASAGIGSFIGPNNVIAYNGRFGIGAETDLSAATVYTIFGNRVLQNANAGFFGPLDSGAGYYNFSLNEFAYNGNGGIRVFNAGTRARLIANEMYGNAGLGFDIGTSGPDPIDPGDPDEGPNRRLNAPEIIATSFFVDPGPAPKISVEYRVDATAANAAYPLQVYAFWTERAEVNQGRYFINSVEYATPQLPQTSVFNLPPFGVPPNATSGGRLVLMVNDADGNSSEYSASVDFGFIELIFRDGYETLGAGF